MKILILDIDGVLTTGNLLYGPEGEVLKEFNVKDGMGMHLFQKAGGKICILSNGQAVEAVERRMEKLKITTYHVGSGNKGEILSKWMSEFNWEKKDIWYMGDDINDLEVKPYVETFCCPVDAEQAVIEQADWISTRDGGRGAVRDLCNFILNNGKLS